ncbi:MAG: hypothetical protein Q9170_002696 [Blastenia crenularia]
MVQYESEDIYIIYSGLHGYYKDIKKGFEHESQAIRWCRDQLKLVDNKETTTTNSLANGTSWEVTMWSPVRDMIVGYTIEQLPLSLVEVRHLPPNGSLIHAVYDEQTSKAFYVSTDFEDASIVCNSKTGCIVKSVEFRQGGSNIPASTFQLE